MVREDWESGLLSSETTAVGERISYHDALFRIQKPQKEQEAV